MTDLNLQQLRSASSNLVEWPNANVGEWKCKRKCRKCNGNGNPNEMQNVQERSHEDVICLKTENDTQRKRIDELTLYIQQATEG